VDTNSLRGLLKRAEALFRGSAASQQADALGKFAKVLDEAHPRSVDDFIDRARPPPPPAPSPRAEEVAAQLERIHQDVDEPAFTALFEQLAERHFSKAAAIEVKPTYGLSEADVERMVEESFTYAEADVEARLLIEARNEADTVITHVERALGQGSQLVGADEHETIVTALETLRRARATDDRVLIREATTGLNRATEHLAELMMDAALKGALASRRADEIMER